MKTTNLLIFGMLYTSIGFFGACSSDDNNGTDTEDGTDEMLTEVINNYVDRTVLPTYSEMKENVWTLLEKVTKFKETGSQSDLNSACDAWRAARKPWEKSEGFLFGPAHDQGLDPHLDSWPLLMDNINNVLNSTIDLSSTNVRETLNQSAIGFHTLEYLLFQDSQPRTAGTITDRQKEYMLAVATILRDDALSLWALWSGGEERATARDTKILFGSGVAGDDYEEGLDLAITEGGFAATFTNPVMVTGSRYKTRSDVINQIVDGCVDIANEVGDQKIGNPWRGHDVYAVESWYSWNSLEDYENNIISIENTYLGGPEGSRDRSTSLSFWVASKKIVKNGATIDGNQMDKDITAAIQATRAAINPATGIPYPFRTQVEKQQNADKVEAAMDRCSELKTQLERIKTLL
jgi:hypothetical protein